MASKPRQTRYEIPVGEIEDLMKSSDRVNLKISRRNSKGQLAHVWSGEKATSELITLDQWLLHLAGGGDYQVNVRDAAAPTRSLIEPFNVPVEGPSRPPAFAGSAPEQVMPASTPFSAPAAFGASPYGMPPDFTGGQDQMSQQPFVPPLPPWAMGLDPFQRSGYDAHRASRYGRGGGYPGPTVASDELAIKQAAELKAEVAKLAEKHEALMQRYESDVGRLRDENAAARAQVAQAKQDAEMSALKAQLEAMRTMPKETGPKFDIAAIGTVLAAVAPVMQAFISSNAEKQSLALRTQQESMQQLMNATLSQANKDSGMKEMLTTFGPLLLPIIQQMFAQKDPEKQAALYEAMATNNLNSIAMMAQLVESMTAGQGPEPPWYYGAVMQALNGVMNIADAYVKTPGGLPGQQRAQLSPPRPSGAMEAAKAVHRPAARAPQQPQQEAPSYTDDTELTRVIPAKAQTLLPFLPAEFQGEGWGEFLTRLHEEPQWSPQWLGEGLSELIIECVDNDTLPEPLRPMLVEGTDYKGVLMALVERLPIALEKPHYVEAVIDVAVAELHNAVNEAMNEESGATVEVLPARSEPVEVPPSSGKTAMQDIIESTPMDYAKVSSS